MTEEKTPEGYVPAPTLDLSKIKNITAAKDTVGEEFAEKVETNAKKARKAKFCFTEEHDIEIPTGGLLYQDAEDKDIRSGIVRLQPMSLADEEIISNQSYAKNGSTFRHLLNNCVLNNFDVKKFAAYDVYYLLHALRRITYGNDYKFEITCPDCGKKYEYSMDISQAEFEQLKPEDNVHSVEKITLPVSKYTIVIKMASLGDEEEVNRLSKRYEASDVVLGYVARTISILDDKNEPVNPNDFVDFFEALHGRDRAEITKRFEKLDDLKIPILNVVCPKCGAEEETTIPFNKEFFRY